MARIGARVFLVSVLAAGAPCVARADDPPAEVSAVTVAARRFVVQRQVDRTVYRVDDATLSAGLGASDLLQDLPGVSVNAAGGVSLHGDSHVVILVDGHPSALVSSPEGLETFPADQVERVEVMSPPPAEYAAQGTGGVINLVTRKGTTEGLSGAVRGNVGWKGRGKLGGDFSYRRGVWTLSGDGAYRPTYSAGDMVSSQTADGQALTSRRAERAHPPMLWGTLTARLTLPGSELALTAHNWEHGGGTSFVQRLDPMGTTDRGTGRDWGQTSTFELSAVQKLGLPDETLKLDVQHTLNSSRSRSLYGPEGTPPQSYVNSGTDQRTDAILLDYVRPQPHDGKFKAGLAYTRDRYAFGLIPGLGDPGETATLRLDQSAAYVEEALILSRWTVQTGLRWEEGRLVSTSQGVVIRERLYQGLFPSLHLERGLGPHDRLTAAVSRRLNRPDDGVLDPLVDTSNPAFQTRGNALLKSEDQGSEDLGYAYDVKGFSASIGLFARQSRDALSYRLSAAGPGILLSQPINLGHSARYGVQVEAEGGLTTSLTYKLSFSRYREDLGSPYGGRAGLAFSGKATLTWKPTGADAIEGTLGQDADALRVGGVEKGFPYLNLSLRHDLTPALAISLIVRNVGDLQTQSRTVRAPGLSYDWRSDYHGDFAYLGFSYRFGKGARDARADQP